MQHPLNYGGWERWRAVLNSTNVCWSISELVFQLLRRYIGHLSFYWLSDAVIEGFIRQSGSEAALLRRLMRHCFRLALGLSSERIPL